MKRHKPLYFLEKKRLPPEKHRIQVKVTKGEEPAYIRKRLMKIQAFLTLPSKEDAPRGEGALGGEARF